MEISRTKVQQPEQVQAAKRTETIRRETLREAAAQETKPAESNPTERKSVLNGQGQVIGSRLNVSA